MHLSDLPAGAGDAMNVEDFVRDLGYCRDVDRECVFNPWSDFDEMDIGDGPAGRRRRLKAHLDRIPRFLLIGEAPGYQGCHFSGIPFTSERQLIGGEIPGIELTDRITKREKPWSEPSATVVWGALHALGIANETVLWNAFPWHPHHDVNRYTNRAPTFKELETTVWALSAVVNMFTSARVVAIGRMAEHALKVYFARSSSGHPAKKFVAVRHPARGGAGRFRSQLAAIVSEATNEGRVDSERASEAQA